MPGDAKPGDYPIQVVESAPQGSNTLDLTVTVAAQVDNGISLKADFPSLSGGPTDTFTYNLTVTNNTPTQQSFNFTGTGPDGWTVTASPTAQARANTVTIDAGGNSTVQVTATPPSTVAEGTYPIDVDITGAEVATVRSSSAPRSPARRSWRSPRAISASNLSGSANETTKETITGSNSGTKSLDKASFSATPPAGGR